MKDDSASISRKEVLRTIVALPAVGAAVVASATSTEAAASITQKTAAYQNKPKNGKDCDDCRFFIVASSKSAPGTCQIVVGKISPNGWCKLFASK